MWMGLTRKIRFQVAGARMVPIRSITTAASALVLGNKLVDSEQADVTSALAARVLARRRASDGPISIEYRK